MINEELDKKLFIFDYYKHILKTHIQKADIIFTECIVNTILNVKRLFREQF